MTETFRLRKSVKYQGMFFSAVSFASVIGASSIFFMKDLARHGFRAENSAAVVGGISLVVTGTFLLLSLYTWVSYHMKRFTISGKQISNRSIFQDHQFDVSDLASLQWRIGSIHFRGSRVKSRLDLDGYSKGDKLRIIQVLHDIVPAAVQEGWSEFCDRVALPLRDGDSPLLRGAAPSECVTITRARYDRMLPLTLTVSIIIGVSLWAWIDFWPALLMLPLGAIAFWLMMRFNVLPEGRVEQRMASAPELKAMLLAFGLLGSSLLLRNSLPLLGVEKSTAEWIACGFLGLAGVLFLFSAHSIDKRKRAANEQRAKSAPERWLQGASSAVGRDPLE